MRYTRALGAATVRSVPPQAKLEEENERLVTEVGEANRQRTQEAAEEQSLAADNAKREVRAAGGSSARGALAGALGGARLPP